MKGEERHEVYSSQSFIQDFKLGGGGVGGRFPRASPTQ